MKIPETSANVGAYYGNEENGQWQPNGVIIDSGVGGGVVGSGDAGVHRPPVYPVHIPRGHIPGYVMAGAYYPPAYPVAPAPPVQDDFEDYMWMENEEEFDKQVMQQLEEEALMEQCIEAMLEDEQRERRAHNGDARSSNGNNLSLEETVSRSTLNPLAAEFVPTRVRSEPHIEEKKEYPKESTASDIKAEGEAPVVEVTEEKPAEVKPERTEESSPAEIAEVSALDADKRPKDSKKDGKPKDVKKPAPKAETKVKTKPVAVKSEPKVQPKKKEVKPVKSEGAVDEKEAPAVEPLKQSQPEEPLGPKPINYAAAARAHKPKPTDKATPPVKVDKKPADKAEKKDKPKVEKPVARKNSAK